ncbi:HEAT repeat domain-containing protein [Gimesia algae]|uniref:HEAT repeat protein n=1 Tax=Gimesia algae TaxID=2527971 RepID=A0A517VNE7_9PLAN|nr:HEAT repeat domain-containing protein [Gimesia algae]QDT94551.1 HEAT repeat protein [Gimesia algae]
MQVFRVVFSVSLVLCTFSLKGCGGSASTDSSQPASAESKQPSPVATAPEQTVETIAVTAEPVDPQAEVKAVFETLLSIRTEPDPDEWIQADKKLSSFGKTAVPTLKDAMSHSDPGARELASMYLASLGPDAKEAAPVLETALQDASPFTQVNAASTLTHFPEYREKAIPVLISLTEHPDPNTRLTSIYALGNLESQSADQLSAIKAALNDSDPDVQLAAIKVLGQMGNPAKTTLTELQTLIDNTDTSEVLREAALSTKSQIEQSQKK